MYLPSLGKIPWKLQKEIAHQKLIQILKFLYSVDYRHIISLKQYKESYKLGVTGFAFCSILTCSTTVHEISGSITGRVNQSRR